MKRRRAGMSLVAVSMSVALVATGCSSEPVSGDVATSSPSVSREAAGVTGPLSLGLPIDPVEIVSLILGNQQLLTSLFGCLMGFGCLEKQEDPTQLVLREISSQLTAVKAEVQAGVAATRVDLATGEYAAAQRAYDEKFGDHIDVAADYLARMTDSSLTQAQRDSAKRSFMREGAVLVPATSASAVRGYLGSVAGNGGTVSSGGMLGAAWNLISAQERSIQGDGSGNLPAFLPAKSANLMMGLGTQRLLEATQFLMVMLAYELVRNPKRYEDTRAQDRLRRDLNELWINGTGTIPGMASITAALPRELPNQSGVFTQGFGNDVAASGGLLVRNFGPTVETATRTGPIVSADAGYSLAPGIDEWLVVTSVPAPNRQQSDYVAVRDLTVSRTHDAWAYNPASGSLTTTVTTTDFQELSGELGPLVATHPATPKSGDTAGFSTVGSPSAEEIGWELDPTNARIRVRGATGLCLAIASRDSSSRDGKYESLRPGLRGYQAGYRKLAWSYRPTMGITRGFLSIPPRLQLTDCANDSLQQWFLEGPVPKDGLPFGSPAELLPLSGANVEAIDSGYPLEDWSQLTGSDVDAIFSLLKTRGVDAKNLFGLYGSALTRGDERALPPILHLPLSWGGPGFTDSYLPPSELEKLGPAFCGVALCDVPNNPAFQMAGVAFPVSGGKFAVRTFDVAKPPTRNQNAVDLPGLSTAAILGMRVESCAFAFLPPRGSDFPCAYKNEVRDQIAGPPVTLSGDSLLEQLPGDESDLIGDPSDSPSPSPSDSPSPLPSDSPSPSPSESPSSSPSETTSPSPDEPSREPDESASPTVNDDENEENQ